MPSAATRNTLPPSPPSPPSGPPSGMNFSRRKPTQPFPPSPASTRMVASSKNFIMRNADIRDHNTRSRKLCLLQEFQFSVMPVLRPTQDQHDEEALYQSFLLNHI